jgi:hypothetical protein
MVAGRKDRIVISAVVGDDHKLIIDLPPDSPIGPVQVVVEAEEPISVEEPSVPVNPERERLRAILLAAGKLGTAHIVEDITYPTDEEWMNAGIMPPGTPPSEETLRELRSDE